ncbi:MAG: LemA family protein [Alphaproteobacteria bacterium]|nr:LemA family protein [Alphaproteobacteria bacterium]
MANLSDTETGSHTARIARMERDGLLSPSQAAQLRDSIQPRSADDSAGPTRGRWPARWIGVFLVTVLVIAVIAALFGSGGGPQTVQDVSSALNQPGGVGEMNATVSKLIAVAILLIVPLLLWALMHNSLVAKEESVFEAWAQTESNYQRRADLVPALVESVTRFIQHESEILTEVTRERGQSTGRLTEAIDELIRTQTDAADALRANPEVLIEDQQKLAQLFAGQASVGRSVGNLFAVVEAYPELRSGDQFLELQAQLEGTENRINVARQRFNDAVGDFNGTLRKLPWSLIASAGNFQRKAYFQSEEDARNAPKLNFN